MQAAAASTKLKAKRKSDRRRSHTRRIHNASGEPLSEAKKSIPIWRETFQQNLASVHKKSVSEAATATDVFRRSYCCSLEPVLQRCGATGLTGLENTICAKHSKKFWRLFTRSPFLKPPPQQTCSAGLIVAVWNHSCSDAMPQAFRI